MTNHKEFFEKYGHFVIMGLYPGDGEITVNELFAAIKQRLEDEADPCNLGHTFDDPIWARHDVCARCSTVREGKHDEQA
jgi:hypothetical protein